MIAQVRRIALIVALVVAAVSAWSTVADAAGRGPQVTATPQVTITGAGLSSTTDLEVYGTATCGQSGGQADLFVSGLQLLDFVYAATTTTVNCTAGAVAWHVTLTTYPGWRSFDWVVTNALLTDSTGTATHSTNFFV